MQKIQENRHCLLAFGLGIITPFVCNYLYGFIRQQIQSYHNKKIFICGVQINVSQYKIIIGQCQPSQKDQARSFNIRTKLNGQVTENYEEMIGIISERIKQEIKPTQKYAYIGVASFGSVEVDKNHLKYGYVMSSPLQNWNNVPLLYSLSDNFPQANSYIETRASAAAIGQFQLANYQIQSLVYVIVDEEVGVGIIQHKKPVHGLTHPKCGHILVNRHKNEKQNFKGVCSHHEDCLEGMVSLKSLLSRLGVTSVEGIGDKEEIWQMVGYYLSQLCYNLTMTFSPEVIVFSGKTMRKKIIYEHIRKCFIHQMNNMKQNDEFQQPNIEGYIKESQLGEDASLYGAMLLPYI